jgi:hypothetical protein
MKRSKVNPLLSIDRHKSVAVCLSEYIFSCYYNGRRNDRDSVACADEIVRDELIYN